jgi:hypothetical protein
MTGLLLALVGFFGVSSLFLFRRAAGGREHRLSTIGGNLLLSQRPHAPGRFGNEQCSGRPIKTSASGLTKTEAENLLDWLEANDCPPAHLTYSARQGFAITR